MIRIKINKMSEAYDNREASNNYNPNELQDMRLPDESPHDQLPQAWALHMPNGEPISKSQTVNTIVSPDTYPVLKEYSMGEIATDAIDYSTSATGEELASKGLEKIGSKVAQTGTKNIVKTIGSNVAKGAGSAVAGANAIYGLATAERDGTWQTDLRNTLKSAFGFVGGTLGSIGGAALGTAVAPGVGTAVGGIAGGTAGSMAGEKFGNSVADISQAIDDTYRLSKDQWKIKHPTLATLPVVSNLLEENIEYLELDENLLYEKKDRCYRLAKQKYDVFPSAYASGFIVRCRKGKVGRKKKANEELEIDEEWSEKYKRSIDCDNPKGFSQRAHCQGRKKNESLNLDDVLDSIDSLLEGTFDKEKSQGLHGWFARKGGKGKSKGWVDCNTCRTNPKTGRKTCKTCGRQSGEKRSKYPACRPTPSACTTRGTSKKRGPTRVSWKKKKKEE